jgi:hypothetical protein
LLRVVAALRGELILFGPVAKGIDGGRQGLAERRDRVFRRHRHGCDSAALDPAVALETLENRDSIVCEIASMALRN